MRCGELIPAKRVATVHKILSSRIYSGDFDWKGKTYKGTYEPLVTRELWQWVQDALAGHRGTRIRKAKHDFPFSGLISCGHCGCALVGDIKKGKYVYYRCSGFKGKEGRDLILDAPHPRQFPLRPYRPRQFPLHPYMSGQNHVPHWGALSLNPVLAIL